MAITRQEIVLPVVYSNKETFIANNLYEINVPKEEIKKIKLSLDLFGGEFIIVNKFGKISENFKVTNQIPEGEYGVKAEILRLNEPKDNDLSIVFETKERVKLEQPAKVEEAPTETFYSFR